MQMPSTLPPLRHVTAGGGRVAVYRGAGPECPLLLIHGGGSDSSTFAWQRAWPHLGTRPLLAVDLPGYGASPAPVSWSHFDGARARPSPMRFHARLLPALLDALDIATCDLLGVSMGGAIALEASLTAPERVRRLVLVDSYGLDAHQPGGTAAWLATRSARMERAIRYAVCRSPLLVAWGLARMMAPGRPNDRDLLAMGVAAVRDRGIDHPAWRAFQKYELGPWGARRHFRHRLGDLAMPVLLIHGRHDRLIPLRLAQAATERIPRATLHVMDDCGHIPHIEAPRRFAEAVHAFLDGIL